MYENDLEVIKNEYLQSKRVKTDTLHKVWKTILDQYGMNDYMQVARYLEGLSGLNIDTLSATNGRVPSMNTMLRKMNTIGTIRQPKFAITSDNPWDEPIANVLDTVFEQVKNRIGWTPEMRRVGFAALFCGTGVAKTGLSSQYLYGETAWSDDIPSKAKESLPEIDQITPYGPTTEFQNFKVKDEYPNLVWVPSTDIFHNPGARRFIDVARTYHRQRRRLVDVVRDARYDKDFREAIHAHYRYRGCDDDEYYLTDIDTEYFKDTAYTEVVECFDHSSRKFCVFSKEVDVPARDWTSFGLPIDTPYHYHVPIEHPELMWGIPYGLVILTQVLAKNQLRAKLIDSISRNNKTLNLVDTESLGVTSAEFVEKLNSMPDGAYVDAPGIARAEGKVVQQFTTPGADAEVLKLMSLVEGDLAEISGLTDAARNTTTQGDQTATEVNQRNQQQGLTVDDFVQRNEEFQEECAADICQIVLSEWDDQQVIKVTGPRPEIYFYVQLERWRVLKNFQIKIVAGSTERLDKLTMRRQWNEALDRVAVLNQYAERQMQMQMMGQPSGPVDWNAAIEVTLDMYDTTFKHRILHGNNIAQLLLRLIGEHNVTPVGISPQLIQMATAVANQPLGAQAPIGMSDPASPSMPSSVVPFPSPQGAPMATSAFPQVPGGPVPQVLSGNQSGRTFSEGAMV